MGIRDEGFGAGGLGFIGFRDEGFIGFKWG